MFHKVDDGEGFGTALKGNASRRVWLGCSLECDHEKLWLSVQAAMDACGANAECQGFQYCFPAPGTAGNAIGRIRLKGGSLGALNISKAIYNPYCRSPPPLSTSLSVLGTKRMPISSY